MVITTGMNAGGCASALDELTVENAELKDGARYLKKPAVYFAKESLPRYAFMTTLRLIYPLHFSAVSWEYPEAAIMPGSSVHQASRSRRRGVLKERDIYSDE